MWGCGKIDNGRILPCHNPVRRREGTKRVMQPPKKWIWNHEIHKYISFSIHVHSNYDWEKIFTFREWKYFREHEKYQSVLLKTVVNSLLFKSLHELNMNHLSITDAPVFGFIKQTYSAKGTENWVGKLDMFDDIKSDSLDKASCDA